MMRDFASRIVTKRAISPVSVADNTAQVSQIIDVRDYDSLTFLLNIGSVADADATFAVLIEHGAAANLSDAAACAEADLTTQTAGTAAQTAAGFQFDSDNQVRKIGYIGNQRYVRMTVTPAANASAALISAVALLGRPHQMPVTQPTA